MSVDAVPDALVGDQLPAIAAPTRPSVRASGEPSLVAQHLAKQYRGRTVLRDVSLSVHRGEAVGLLGPNGAGKTTSFYIITGLIAADAGQVLLGDQDITRLPMYRRECCPRR